MGKNTTNNQSSQPILGQLLSFIPREVFKKCVDQCQADKWYKQVKTWDQFVFMLYGVLTGSSSLREITRHFMLMGDKLAHCGIFKIPRRSSISDANARRRSDVFAHLYTALYQHYQEKFSDSYLSMKINGEVAPSQVEVFDSTVMTLFKEIFKGCGRLPDNGRKKGGIKAFTKMNLSERVPNFISLKAAARNEKSFLASLDLAKDSIAVFDKGFNTFSQYEEWDRDGIFYLTRMQDNTRFNILNQRSLEDQCEDGVRQDADIALQYYCSRSRKTQQIQTRMVAYIDPVSQEELVFLTNLMTLQATTICQLYKNRWVIEPLFKQIKQNFELTYFLADSVEGVKTQIWIAMILNLIFTLVHKMTKEAEDFATMVKLAAKNTASYVAFISFLKMSPTEVPPALDNLEKMQLDLFTSQQGGDFEDSG